MYEKMYKTLACLCALCITSATYSSMASVYASEELSPKNVAVTMQCLYDDPAIATRYSKTKSLSSYGGSWILISGNFVNGGFYMTFDVVSDGRLDNHTQKINLFNAFWENG